MGEEGAEPMRHPGARPSEPDFWSSRTGVVFTIFAAVAATYLLFEHWSHVVRWLPLGLLVLCPLLHLFMWPWQPRGSRSRPPG
jgi:hypothetical protein